MQRLIIILLFGLLLQAPATAQTARHLRGDSDSALSVETPYLTPKDDSDLYPALTPLGSFICNGKYKQGSSDTGSFADTQDATYRLIYLSKEHLLVSVSIEQRRGNHMLYWKSYRLLGLQPISKLAEGCKSIDTATWQMLQALLKALDFWRQKRNLLCSSWTSDPRKYVLEGNRAGQYHAVVGWAPGSDANYIRCCSFLLDLMKTSIQR